MRLDRRLVQCVAPLFIAGCASAPEVAAPPRASTPQAAVQEWAPLALRNPGFEDDPHAGSSCASGWDCTMHADPNSFRFFLDEALPAQGKRSLCIEPLKKEPWGTASQGWFDIAQIRGGRVRFSAAVRLDAVTGDGAGPFVDAQGIGGGPIARAERLLQGTQGWQRIAVELDVPSGATLIEFGVTLEGRGRVCLDDARLEILRTKKSPV
jgi:hypothetical protein